MNERQAAYYDGKTTRSWITRLFGKARGRFQNDFREALGIKMELYDLHKRWIGSLTGKRVLDLGCHSGNYLSLYLAEQCDYYTAIDLSEEGISRLRRRLKNSSARNYTTIVGDFMEAPFDRGSFDVVYAYGVLHHFRDLDKCLKRIIEVSEPGGRIVTYDPLQTSLPVRTLRLMYRPFQTDSEWEWPFRKSSFDVIQRRVVIEDMRGYFNRLKWGFLVWHLPVPRDLKTMLLTRWREYDDAHCSSVGPALWGCMHVAMSLRSPRCKCSNAA